MERDCDSFGANGVRALTWPSGAGRPHNHAGVLSGTGTFWGQSLDMAVRDRRLLETGRRRSRTRPVTDGLAGLEGEALGELLAAHRGCDRAGDPLARSRRRDPPDARRPPPAKVRA